jgi:hypothetical protein
MWRFDNLIADDQVNVARAGKVKAPRRPEAGSHAPPLVDRLRAAYPHPLGLQ